MAKKKSAKGGLSEKQRDGLSQLSFALLTLEQRMQCLQDAIDELKGDLVPEITNLTAAVEDLADKMGKEG